MPIVINELVFKGEIQAPTRGKHPAEGEKPRVAADFDDVVEACVEQVMRALERMEER